MKRIVVSSLAVILGLIIISCGNKSSGLAGIEAGAQLKPSKQMEIDLAEIPHNLEVIVKNVADNSNSNKNYFKLYVNKQQIQPQNVVDNTTSEYQYKLKLLPGFYDIKGVYYWNDGWKDLKTEIKTEELVRVDEKGLTRLEKEIPKDWRGVVQGKNLLFEASYTEFDRGDEGSPAQFVTDSVSNQSQIVGNKRKNNSGSKRIKFQINTDPVKCDVYINDELIGTSPISWWVDRSSVHVVQVRADGYRTGIRVIPPEEMQGEDKVVVILRLDALPNYEAISSANKPAVAGPLFMTQDTTLIDSIQN